MPNAKVTDDMLDTVASVEIAGRLLMSSNNGRTP
jgi:hypothetical protein